ncbi:hypothetical protein [Streptosporangium longisporum]
MTRTPSLPVQKTTSAERVPSTRWSAALWIARARTSPATAR